MQNEILDGQWVQLTSMRDGLKRPPIPRVHAERVLRKKLSDGSPAFWVEGMPYSPPAPQIGSIKCYFHPEFDEADGPSGISREFIVQAGVGDFTCNAGDLSKNNRGDFKSIMQRDAHMRSRHRRQLQAVEQALGNEQEQAERTERQLDREYQRQQTEAMLRLLERQTGAPNPVLAEQGRPRGVRGRARHRDRSALVRGSPAERDRGGYMKNLNAIAYEDLSVTDTAGGLASQPDKALHALIYVEGAPIRFRADGTAPTASVGMYVAAGDYIDWTEFNSQSLMARASFIRVGGTSATLRVQYFA